MSSSMTQLAETTFVRKLQMAGIGTAAVGIILSIAGMMTDMHRFLFDYLIAFVFWGGIAVTAALTRAKSTSFPWIRSSCRKRVSCQ